MTPSDELWIEMAQFDTHLADGIWDGTTVPDDPPPWYGRVATLIRAAKAPARPDELAAEDEIVALMRRTVLEAAPADAGAPVGPPVDVAALAEVESLVEAEALRDAAVLDGVESLVEAPVESSPVESSPNVAASAEIEPPVEVGVPVDGTPPADVEVTVAAADGSGGDRRPPRHLRLVEAPAPDDEDDGRVRPLHLRPQSGRGRAGRVIRRLVAVKAVAATTAVAIGITAAAATTGIVTVVVPAARDRLLTDDKPSGEVVDEDAPSDDSGPRSDGTYEVPQDCDRDAAACTTPDGTRIDPQTGEPLDAGEDAGTPDAEADDATTETTIAGEGSSTDPADQSPSTTGPAPTTGEPTDPVTTDTTVPTTDTTIGPEETTTSTSSPDVGPMSDPDGQGTGG